MVKILPVAQDDLSDARKIAMSVMSLTFPALLSGIPTVRDSHSSLLFSHCSRLILVSTSPGAMALTLKL